MRRNPTRRAVLATVAGLLAGCSGTDGTGADGETPTQASDTPTTEPDGGTSRSDDGDGANPAIGDAEQMGELRLTSSAFEDGEEIPRTYGRDGENVNPPLTVENVPDGAETLVLIVDDPDAVEPAGKVWLHWLVWNVPATRTEIPEGWEPTTAVVGENDFGNRRYDGPDPPDGPHTYRFKLYALETTLDVPDSATKESVGDAMRGAVLARTQLTGTYAP